WVTIGLVAATLILPAGARRWYSSAALRKSSAVSGAGFCSDISVRAAGSADDSSGPGRGFPHGPRFAVGACPGIPPEIRSQIEDIVRAHPLLNLGIGIRY